MAQDERRAMVERSRHIDIGIEYLPAVARLRESEEWRYVEREIDLRLAPVE